jgi:hypothetical protein
LREVIKSQLLEARGMRNWGSSERSAPNQSYGLHDPATGGLKRDRAFKCLSITITIRITDEHWRGLAGFKRDSALKCLSIRIRIRIRITDENVKGTGR